MWPTKSSARRSCVAGHPQPIPLSQTSRQLPRDGAPRSRSSARQRFARVLGPIGPMSTSNVSTVGTPSPRSTHTALQLWGSSPWPGTRHSAGSRSTCTTPAVPVIRVVLAVGCRSTSQGRAQTSTAVALRPLSPRTNSEGAEGAGGGAAVRGVQPTAHVHTAAHRSAIFAVRDPATHRGYPGPSGRQRGTSGVARRTSSAELSAV